MFLKNGPILTDYNLHKKKKLKYAFAVGIYEFQKARVRAKQVQEENEINFMDSESSDMSRFANYLKGKDGSSGDNSLYLHDCNDQRVFIYSSAHLRDMNVL